MEPKELLSLLDNGSLDKSLSHLYGSAPQDLAAARARYRQVIEAFAERFPGIPATLVSAPGRTELGGNHTDHQHGRVLAASVGMDMIACVGPNGSDEVRLYQDGFEDLVLNIKSLEKRPEEVGHFPALVRGVANRFAERGYQLSGFSGVVDSQVLTGSGLSSSAAYEVLIGNILNSLFAGGEISAVEIAQIGQFAENVYFEKPSGLMDQMTCSVGGVVGIDFQDPAHPAVHEVDFDLESVGYVLCSIDSGADHADLTEDYSQITHDMRDVAEYFGAEWLRSVEPSVFWANLAAVLEATNDRAVLRAIHFFEDDTRVPLQIEALENGGFPEYLDLVRQSGASSAQNLQNIYSANSPRHQRLGVTIALASHLLRGQGAVRVHGGGFAGTVQAYVPAESADQFKNDVEEVLGDGACHILRIRPTGGTVISPDKVPSAAPEGGKV